MGRRFVVGRWIVVVVGWLIVFDVSRQSVLVVSWLIVFDVGRWSVLDVLGRWLLTVSWQWPVVLWDPLPKVVVPGVVTCPLLEVLEVSFDYQAMCGRFHVAVGVWLTASPLLITPPALVLGEDSSDFADCWSVGTAPDNAKCASAPVEPWDRYGDQVTPARVAVAAAVAASCVWPVMAVTAVGSLAGQPSGQVPLMVSAKFVEYGCNRC